jgi:hypothetical protein
MALSLQIQADSQYRVSPETRVPPAPSINQYGSIIYHDRFGNSRTITSSRENHFNASVGAATAYKFCPQQETVINSIEGNPKLSLEETHELMYQYQSCFYRKVAGMPDYKVFVLTKEKYRSPIETGEAQPGEEISVGWFFPYFLPTYVKETYAEGIQHVIEYNKEQKQWRTTHPGWEKID